MDNLVQLLNNFVIKFSGNVNDLLKCTICKNVLVDTYVSPCTCKFCWNCIDQYLRNSGITCPGAKDKCRNMLFHTVNEFMKDTVTDKQISFLLAECPNENCDYQCQLRNLSEHMRTCGKAALACLFSYVGCVHGSVAYDKMEEHLDDWSVAHGRALVAHIRNMENEMKERMDHYERLLEALTTEKVVLQRVVETNVDDIGRMNEANNALSANESTLLRENAALKEELWANREDATVLQQKVHRNSAEIDIIKKEIRALSSKTDSDKPKLQAAKFLIKRRIEVRNDTMQHKVQRLEEEPVSNIRILPAAVVTDPCAFVWRIEGISEKLDKANEYSRPFFSDADKGYKMCVFYRMSSSAGLYLTFLLMRGDNDNILQWPMSRTVLIEIVDEQGMKPVISRKVSYATTTERIWPIVRKKAYDKPTSNRNNCGDGFIRCVKYEQIKSMAGAIRNDAMTVRCLVLPR